MSPAAPKMCFDRMLPRELFRPRPTRSTRGRVRATIEFRKMWVNGSALRVRFLEGTMQQKRTAMEQANWWTPFANTSFAFTDDDDAEIRVSFDPEDGAWSYVGTEARNIPRGQATMNLSFLDGGTAAHEFGHALGLAHEHQSPFGGMHWNEAVVTRAMAGPPNYWSPEETRFNILAKYTVDQIRGTQFDPDSIMLYAYPPSFTTDHHGTKANEVLSETDTSFIGSEQGYPKGAAVEPIALKVNASRATRGDIGTPGEEDLYAFKVARKGRHMVETGGETDMYVKLFGPDSPTRLIAEDDDSGRGANARVVADLVPGNYLVQVRHFNRAGGTGKYSVQVRT